jgi:hypothetical protein
MTSNVKRHVQLPRSSQKGKKPTAEDLKYGEIAVNFNVEEPFLAMKGSDDSIITMGFKDGKSGPWKKGEGEYSAVLDNGTPTSPIDTVNTATKRYATAEGKGSTASGDYSHAEGQNTTASGESSHAEGQNTTASGAISHAEGYNTTASGINSHAEGKHTTASLFYSHAEGNNTTASGESSHAEGNNTTASGSRSHAEGDNTTAKNQASHAEGNGTTASGNASHAEGYETTADGENSHAEGNDTTANGSQSHSEGAGTKAIGRQSHAEGNYTIASGENSHAEGNYTTVKGTNSHGEGNHKVDLILVKNIAVGDTKIIIESKRMNIPSNEDYIKNCYITDDNNIYNILTISSYNGTLPANFQGLAKEITVDKPLEKVSNNDTNNPTFTSDIYSFVNIAVGEIDGGHSEGKNNIVLGEAGHAEGKFTMAKGGTSHAEGCKTTAIGDYSHVEGYTTTAEGKYSHAEGYLTKAKGKMSHSEGLSTTAEGEKSHSEGESTTASGSYSHAEGSRSTASGNSSHAEGNNTTASGLSSHSEGDSTRATGRYSHAEGSTTKSVGDFSHSEGFNTNSAAGYSHTEGGGGIAISVASHVEGLHYHALQITDDIAVGSTEMFILASEDYSVNLNYYKNCIITDNTNTVAIDVLSAEYAYNTKFTESNENKRIKLTLKEALPKASTRAEQTEDNQKDGYFYTWDYSIQNKGTIGNYGSHAEGSYTMVYEDSGHAEGKLSISKGKMSHAEGYRTIADGSAAHAEGYQTIAKGVNSHAEGENTTANGNNSHASGFHTTVENDSEFACGKYNKFNVNQIFSIGVGTADNARKNALYITTDGVIGGDSQLTNGGTSMFGLKINGGIQASEGMISPTYLNSSDERLKKDIETISEDDIDKVKNVNLKSYVFKSDNSKHYGVIAQDVEKAGLSELVTNSSDGMKSVDYISLLILKISELENEIKNLKEQINK